MSAEGGDAPVESPFLTVDMCCDLQLKLNLLGYVDGFCRDKDIAPFHKQYFALPSPNQSVQFSHFVSLAQYLLGQCNRKFQIDKMEDPPSIVNRLVMELRDIGLELDFPPMKLRTGNGLPVVKVLCFLVERALDLMGFTFEKPRYVTADEDGGGVMFDNIVNDDDGNEDGANGGMLGIDEDDDEEGDGGFGATGTGGRRSNSVWNETGVAEDQTARRQVSEDDEEDDDAGATETVLYQEAARSKGTGGSMLGGWGKSAYGSNSANADSDGKRGDGDEDTYNSFGFSRGFGGGPGSSKSGTSSSSAAAAAAAAEEDAALNGMIESKVDPQAWRAELERVSSKLKDASLLGGGGGLTGVSVGGRVLGGGAGGGGAVGGGAVSSKEWRAHLDQTSKAQAAITKLLPSTKADLERLATELSGVIESLSDRERSLNNSVRALASEHASVAEKLGDLQSTFQSRSSRISILTNDLAQLSDAIDDLRAILDEQGTSMSDTSPLIKIKAALAALRTEVKSMELHIGVVGHTVMQSVKVSGAAAVAAQASKNAKKVEDEGADEDDDDADDDASDA